MNSNDDIQPERKKNSQHQISKNLPTQYKKEEHFDNGEDE